MWTSSKNMAARSRGIRTHPWEAGSSGKGGTPNWPSTLRHLTHKRKLPRANLRSPYRPSTGGYRARTQTLLQSSESLPFRIVMFRKAPSQLKLVCLKRRSPGLYFSNPKRHLKTAVLTSIMKQKLQVRLAAVSLPKKQLRQLRMIMLDTNALEELIREAVISLMESEHRPICYAVGPLGFLSPNKASRGYSCVRTSNTRPATART